MLGDAQKPIERALASTCLARPKIGAVREKDLGMEIECRGQPMRGGPPGAADDRVSALRALCALAPIACATTAARGAQPAHGIEPDLQSATFGLQAEFLGLQGAGFSLEPDALEIQSFDGRDEQTQRL
ncbi:MAG TPA: hypothetical protein VGP48_06630 [Stellaceae bacterium]|nr:hypothetical protein [Stellaceae bacterium]